MTTPPQSPPVPNSEPSTPTALDSWRGYIKGPELLWLLFSNSMALRRYVNQCVVYERAKAEAADDDKSFGPPIPVGAFNFLKDVAFVILMAWLVLEFAALILANAENFRPGGTSYLPMDLYLQHMVYRTGVIFLMVGAIFLVVGLIQGDVISAAHWGLLLCVVLPLLSIAEMWLRFKSNDSNQVYFGVIAVISMMVGFTLMNIEEHLERCGHHPKNHNGIRFGVIATLLIALAFIPLIAFRRSGLAEADSSTISLILDSTVISILLLAVIVYRPLVRIHESHDQAGTEDDTDKVGGKVPARLTRRVARLAYTTQQLSSSTKLKLETR